MSDKNEETLGEPGIVEPAPEVKEVNMVKKDKPVEVRKDPKFEAERIASRKRAHEAKVAKFLAGGKF